MNAITIERKTVLADNNMKRFPVSIKTGYQPSNSEGASLTETEERIALGASIVVGTGLLAGSIYSVYKAKYALGAVLFFTSGPLAIMTALGLSYFFYKNDSTGV